MKFAIVDKGIVLNVALWREHPTFSTDIGEWVEIPEGMSVGPGWTHGEDGFKEPLKEIHIEGYSEIKSRAISDANDYINSHQWPGKAALMRLTDEEFEQYNLWLDYLDALYAINLSEFDGAWPEKPST